MNTGQILKKQLGLEKYKNVGISFVIGSSPDLLCVFYDSKRPNFPISKQFIDTYSNVWFQKRGKELRVSVPFDIERSNVNINTGSIVVINLANMGMTKKYENTSVEEDTGDFLNKVDSIHYFENGKLIDPPMKMGKRFVGNLEELRELTLKDLKDAKTSTISKSTLDWRKDRNKAGYLENRASKIIDCTISEGDDSFTFTFLSESTEGQTKFSKERGYNYDDPKGEVSTDNLSIKPNKSKLYEIQIKFLGLKEFIDYLKTTPEEKVSKKDIAYLIGNFDVQIFSNSPAYQYQGYNYICSQLDLSIFPTSIPSKQWMPNIFKGEFMLPKHLYGIIQQISFFSQIMAQMLGTKLKSRGLL